MLRNTCAVWPAMSSLTSWPVLGSNPPWPERKIQSPTISPGEYGPAGAPALMTCFMGVRSLRGGVGLPAQRDINIAKFLCLWTA